MGGWRKVPGEGQVWEAATDVGGSYIGLGCMQ